MKVSEIANKLNIDYGSGKGAADREVRGCYIGDLLSLAMAKLDMDNVWITIQTNINVVAVASLKDASCIIIADGYSIDDEVRKKADEEGVIILESSLSAYDLAKKLGEFSI